MWHSYELLPALPAPGCTGDQNPGIVAAFAVLRGVERKVRHEEAGERERRLLEALQGRM